MPNYIKSLGTVHECVHVASVLSNSFVPMDCCLPGSSVHEILQEIILEWIAISFSRESSRPKDHTHVSYVSCVGRQFLHHCLHLGKTFGHYTNLWTWVCLQQVCLSNWSNSTVASEGSTDLFNFVQKKAQEFSICIGNWNKNLKFSYGLDSKVLGGFK